MTECRGRGPAANFGDLQNGGGSGRIIDCAVKDVILAARARVVAKVIPMSRIKNILIRRDGAANDPDHIGVGAVADRIRQARGRLDPGKSDGSETARLRRFNQRIIIEAAPRQQLSRRLVRDPRLNLDA